MSLPTNYQAAPTPSGYLPDIESLSAGNLDVLKSFFGSPSLSAVGPSETDVATLLSDDFAIVDRGMDAELQKAFDSGAIERGSPQEASLRADIGLRGVQAKLSAVIALRRDLFGEFLRGLLQGNGQNLSYEELRQRRVTAQHEILDRRISSAVAIAAEDRLSWETSKRLRLETARLNATYEIDKRSLALREAESLRDVTIAIARLMVLAGTAIAAQTTPAYTYDAKPAATDAGDYQGDLDMT